MKRILIFSITYHPFIGGAEVALKELTDRFPSDEYEFHMVTLRNNARLPKEETLGNVRVHRIGLSTRAPRPEDLARMPLQLNKYLYQFMAAAEAERLHRKFQFDGVWAMMAHAAGIPAGIFKARHPEVPYLLTLQEGDPPEHIERIARPVWPLFVQGFRRADELQAISSFLLAWGKRMGFSGEGEVIPNGVDAKRFAMALPPQQVAHARERLQKKDDEVLLVTTSRLVHKNGIDTVIKALALMPSSVRFIVYGIGVEEEKLRSLAKEKGVESRVSFLGHLSHEELPEALAACDIFVRPSRSEGMGNSFIEAMAAGLPVIATQEGGIADFLFDETRNPEREPTGWAVNPDAPEQIAAAVKDILARPEHAAGIVAHARTLATTRYDWDRIADEMRALFAKTFA